MNFKNLAIETNETREYPLSKSPFYKRPYNGPARILDTFITVSPLVDICMSYIKTPFNNVVHQVDCIFIHALRYIKDFLPAHLSLQPPKYFLIRWFSSLVFSCRRKSERDVALAGDALFSVITDEYDGRFGGIGDFAEDYNFIWKKCDIGEHGEWCLPECEISEQVDFPDDNL